MTSNRFFWLGVIPALFMQSIGAYLYFVVFADTGVASPLYGAIKILLFFWPLVWLMLGAPLPKFKLTIDKRSLGLGLVTGLLMSAVIAAFAVIDFDNLVSFKNALSTKADDLFPLAYYLPIMGVFALLHSLFEEYFWRWFVFDGLRLKLSAIDAAIVSSFAFTLHHIVILSQFFPVGLTILSSLGVFFGGLIWCFSYSKTKKLTASWVSHALVDLTLFAIGYVIIF